MPICRALLLGIIQEALQAVKEQGEQSSSREVNDLVCPAMEKRHVSQIVMRYLMGNYKRDLFIRRANLVQPPRKVDVMSRSGEGCGLFPPWNLHLQPLSLWPTRLKSCLYPSNSLNCPWRIFNRYRLHDFFVKPFTKAFAVANLNVMSHCPLGFYDGHHWRRDGDIRNINTHAPWRPVNALVGPVVSWLLFRVLPERVGSTEKVELVRAACNRLVVSGNGANNFACIPLG